MYNDPSRHQFRVSSTINCALLSKHLEWELVLRIEAYPPPVSVSGLRSVKAQYLLSARDPPYALRSLY